MKTASVHSLQLTKNMRYFVPENGQSGPMEKLTKLQDGPGILWPSPSRRSPSSHQQARSPHASVSGIWSQASPSIWRFESVDPRNHLTRCEPGKVAEIPGINSNISSVVWKYFQLNSTKYYHITKCQWNQGVKILKHSFDCFDSYNRRTVLPGWQHCPRLDASNAMCWGATRTNWRLKRSGSGCLWWILRENQKTWHNTIQ